MAELHVITDLMAETRLEGDTALSAYLETPAVVAVETRNDLGRVVVTTQDAGYGFTIVRESPVMVWRSCDWEDMVTKFKSLNDNDRQGVLDMYHPDLSSPTIAMLKTEAAVVARSLGVSVDLVHKLMAISNTNAHEYYGYEGQQFVEIESNAERIRSGKAALFLFASKVAHSCLPNLTYTSKTSDGKLEYKVTRSLKAGDMLTFSYLDDLWETPTHERRAKLKQSKSFTCCCIRCMGQDYARPLPCTKCSGVVLCTSDTKNDPIWSCNQCSQCSHMENYLKTETDVELELRMWERKMQLDLSQCLPEALKRFMDRISSNLHPQHFLTLRAMKMYVRLCASHAAQMDRLHMLGMPPQVVVTIKRRFGTPSKLYSEAARIGISLVLRMECVAVGCLDHGSSERRGTEHPILQDAMTTIFHAAQDLMRCPKSTWPNNAQAVVHSYIPAMRLQFGNSDSDVAEIENKIPAPGIVDVSCSEVPTKPKGGTINVGGSSRKNNKKKGGSTKKKHKNLRR